MPGRLKRVNGRLTPVIADASIDVADEKVLQDYSRQDDFGYASSPTGEYTVSGTWSAVSEGSNYVSGTTAGNSGGILTLGAGNAVDPTKRLEIRSRVKLTGNDEELFAFYGAFETAPTDADPPVLANDYIGFRLVETTTNANWEAIVGENVGGGGAETAVDTGVVVDLDTFHTFEIVLENGGAEFKIDGIRVAVINTNLPLVPLVPLAKITTGDTNAKGITLDVLKVINSRS